MGLQNVSVMAVLVWRTEVDCCSECVGGGEGGLKGKFCSLGLWKNPLPPDVCRAGTLGVHAQGKWPQQENAPGRHPNSISSSCSFEHLFRITDVY